MYYKENLSLRIISTSYFDQCLLCEVTCQNQKGYIAVIYLHQVSHVMNLKTFYLILKNLQTKLNNSSHHYNNLR